MFQFEAIAPVSHTLVRTALLNVSHPLSVAITTAIALTTMRFVLCWFFQLMAQSTFDERLMSGDARAHPCRLLQSRRVTLTDSTHMPIAGILLSHFTPMVKRLIVLVECLRWIAVIHLIRETCTILSDVSHRNESNRVPE
jgi:hypothetical protein